MRTSPFALWETPRKGGIVCEQRRFLRAWRTARRGAPAILLAHRGASERITSRRRLRDLLDPGFAFDLSSLGVLDVEDVNNLVEVGSDFGPTHGEAHVEEGLGDGVEQAGLVDGENIENGEELT